MDLYLHSNVICRDCIKLVHAHELSTSRDNEDMTRKHDAVTQLCKFMMIKPMEADIVNVLVALTLELFRP